MNKNGSLGIVESPNGTDYLYRISLKALIRNEKGEILVVKESGRDWWDLPGGGLDYGESIKQCLARELKEEIGFDGDFTYSVIAAEEPEHLVRLDALQMCLILDIKPDSMIFSAGNDGDEIAFMPAEELRKSSAPNSHIVMHLDYALK